MRATATFLAVVAAVEAGGAKTIPETDPFGQGYAEFAAICIALFVFFIALAGISRYYCRVYCSPTLQPLCKCGPCPMVETICPTSICGAKAKELAEVNDWSVQEQ